MVEKRLADAIRKVLVFGWWVPFLSAMALVLILTLLVFRSHQVQRDSLVAQSHLPVLEQQIATGDFVSLSRSLKSLLNALDWNHAFVFSDTGRVLAQSPERSVGRILVYTPAETRWCDHQLKIRNATGQAIGTLCWRDVGWRVLLPILPILFGIFGVTAVLQFVVWRRARKLLDDEVARTQRAARQVAHDIVSPLNALRVGLERYTADDAVAMRNALGRIQAIAGQLAGKSDDRREHSVTELIDDVLKEKQMEYAAKSSLMLTAETNTHISLAIVNAREFQRALSNLINNAVEALGPSGGTVSIKCNSEGKDLVVQVEDDGPGIPSEIRAQIDSGVGRGLGLPHARRTVEECGGKLTIRSIPRLGTCIEMRLPAAV
jgi:signal transduction histidine kinase